MDGSLSTVRFGLKLRVQSELPNVNRLYYLISRQGSTDRLVLGPAGTGLWIPVSWNEVDFGLFLFLV